MTFGRKDCLSGDNKCSPKSLREALYCQVNHAQMSRTEIAEVMGINPGTLGKWSDPQGDEHMPDDRLAHLLHLTDDKDVYLVYLATVNGGRVVFDPRSVKTGNVGRMVSEFGDLLKVLDDVDGDKEITEEKAEAIAREGRELIAAVQIGLEDVQRRAKRGPRAVTA
jgi:hypothetical protein